MVYFFTVINTDLQDFKTPCLQYKKKCKHKTSTEHYKSFIPITDVNHFARLARSVSQMHYLTGIQEVAGSMLRSRYTYLSIEIWP